MTFTEYLHEQKLAASSVRHYSRSIAIFLAWLDTEQISPGSFHYNDLMAFIAQLQGRGVNKRTVNGSLTAIRHYCGYLIHQQQRTDNPGVGVYIKGLSKSIPVNLLTTEEMELLYQQYGIQLNVHGSNKIMLGLLIYQGLTVAELIGLRAHHFLMKDGKVVIRGTHHTNERILMLQAHQVHLLQQYLKINKQKEGYLFT